MGANNEIIVALEFGTSAIRGIAGKKKADGSIQILDIEQEHATDAIQRGIIYNIDKTTLAIMNIIRRLSERLNTQIQRAYVGIGGQSLHTAGNFISRGMETKVKVTPELIDNLMDSNRTTQYTDSEILDVIPQEYVVGSRTINDPVGIMTEQIEARFMNVVAKSALLENIRKCMKLAGVEIADMLISPIALADSMLSESEKRSGCALIDFGAGTTTVAVYSGNLLRHLVVIPLGGGNITADIAKSNQMELEEAEALKRKYGIAYVASESDNPQMLSISNDRTLSENTLQNIIGARQEEIIANAWNQIENMGNKLLAGIIITGGGAQMRDMPEAIKHFTQFPKNVKIAKSLITTVDVADNVNTPQGYSVETLIALLLHGDVNCAAEFVVDTEVSETPEAVAAPKGEPEEAKKEPTATDEGEERQAEEKSHSDQEEEKPKEKQKSSFVEGLKKFGRFLGKTFSEEDDD